MSLRRARWRRCLVALIGIVPVVLSAPTPVAAEMLVQNPPASVPSPQQDIQPAAPSTPKPEQQRPSIWGEPTEVRIAIYVIDVDGIDSANQRFPASFYVQARWNIPFLRHEGPAPLIRQPTSVWPPRLVLVNGQQAWSAFPPYVEIAPNGEVAFRQKVWGWFSQPLQLRDFPFDKQRIAFHVVAAGLNENEVKMVPLERDGEPLSAMAAEFSMPDFKVADWRGEVRPYLPAGHAPGLAGFILEIDVERLPSY